MIPIWTGLPERVALAPAGEVQLGCPPNFFMIDTQFTPGIVLGMREGTLLRNGQGEDWLYIDSLRKKEGNALGFIPKDVYISVLERRRVHNRDRWKYQEVLVTEDNGQLTGFCMTSYFSDMANIFQVVVQQDARRWHRALLMVDHVEDRAHQLNKSGVTCRVAMDLESNMFWRGVGYNPVGETISTWLNQKESASKRPLFVYEKSFITDRTESSISECLQP